MTRLVVLGSLLLGLIGNAQAARIGGLYSAELLVAEQSVRVAPELVSQALAQVLVKVSGRRDVTRQAAIEAAMGEANRYIQQFSYQQTNRPLPTDDGREVLAHRLKIDFERTLINQLLSDAGLRPLGTIRPGVLVWLLEERNGQREFIGDEEDPAFLAMKSRAVERGLPVFRPLLDLQDQQALSSGDAWGFFTDSIRRASSRYQADSVLVGRLYRSGGGWRSQWLLLKGQGQRFNFDGEGSVLQNHLGSAVDQAADLLFVDFVASTDDLDPGAVLLEIDQVNSIESYFEINRYLSDLPAVKQVKLQQLDQDRLQLQLRIDGTIGQLRGALGLNKHLQPLELMQPDQPGQLFYRWRP
ncbi:DUF2066 domain-containing protein [Motiliproteus coralliicola]|uniref:DUF2066 domain-containing protein n=1 Tax=Motiliproteus coralliicola TaxID=2283196 RepID=UPI00140408AB|nr:DUF2066 domain-containing protein [Motiliproteus coralliicola]